MLDAAGADHGGEEVAGCEELIDAREAEEDRIDVVGFEVSFHPSRVLDGPIEDGDAVGFGGRGGEAGDVGCREVDVIDRGGFEKERD